MPLPATIKVPTDNGDIALGGLPEARSPEVSEDPALDGVLEIGLRAEVESQSLLVCPVPAAQGQGK